MCRGGDPPLPRRVNEPGPTWTIQEKRGRKLFSRGVLAPPANIAAVDGPNGCTARSENASPLVAPRSDFPVVRSKPITTTFGFTITCGPSDATSTAAESPVPSATNCSPRSSSMSM